MNRKSEPPPVLVGERVSWIKNGHIRSGKIKWIGNIQEIDSCWAVGLELDQPLNDGSHSDGFWSDRKLFECKPKHGVVVPIGEIDKTKGKYEGTAPGNSQDQSKRELDASQVIELAESKVKNITVEKSPETKLKNRYSALESKLTKWGFKNQGCTEIPGDRDETASDGWKKTTGVSKHYQSKPKHDGKLSLKKKGRKRKSFHEYQYTAQSSRKFEEDLQLVRKSLDKCAYFTINEAFIPPENRSGKMNDVAGYFKQIKEEDILEVGTYNQEGTECEKQLGGLLAMDFQGAENVPKERKFFSFLKWFKKNKENSTLKNFKDSSVASSPVFQRRRNSSCESIDTLFSTQTVRSFAYIPPQQYQPSAPPSCLLDFDKSDPALVNQKDCEAKQPENVEPIYDKRKKRRAPGPPRLTRENSLPTTLEHKQKDEEMESDSQTLHRRTVSESFKDKKAGAYCHVQGKRKAPLPPPNAPSIYPNLQKMNSQYQSLQKKKKPAPPPPQTKDVREQRNASDQEDKVTTDVGEVEPVKCDLQDNYLEKPMTKTENKSELLKLNWSPLPSRPWYKRSHRDSGGTSNIRKDLLKGFDRKKINKNTDDWMPEVGYSRKSLSSDNPGKFNIFAKLDAHEDKKKKEKRKSQISILTNISELDKEAAEILRKEHEEEKKMRDENNEKYYTAKSISNIKIETPDNKESSVKTNEVTRELKKGNGTPKSVWKDHEEKIPGTPDNTSKSDRRPGSMQISIPDATENTKPNSSSLVATPDMSNTNLSHFDVKNKEMYYLNEPWVCGKCTLENAGWRVFCEICASVKPRFLYNGNGKTTANNENAIATEGTNAKLNNERGKPRNNDDQADTVEALRRKRINFFVGEAEVPTGINKTDLQQTLNGDNESSFKKEKSIVKGEEQQKELKCKTNAEERRELAIPGTSNAITDDENLNEERNCDFAKINQETGNKNKVVEAYVVTKTTVLEDIIIKKAEKVTKVSTAAQTYGNKQVIRAQPRQKKPGTSADSTAGKIWPTAYTNPLDLSPTDDELPSENVKKLRDNLEELTRRLTRAEGLADFKATVKKMAPETGMNTIAVNRLMKKLEMAINGGDHFVAAGLAKEMALLINCSATRQGPDIEPTPHNSTITVDMYLEDKVSHQGPIQIRVSPSMTLLQLKKKVQEEMGIPIDVQRWILDKRLATDDNKTLESDGVKQNSCSIFLYLVAPASGQPEPGTSTITVEPLTHEKDKQNMQSSEGKHEFNSHPEEKAGSSHDGNKNVDSQVKEKIGGTCTNHTDQTMVSETSASIGGAERPDTTLTNFNVLHEETDLDKELKLISVNSVKQKVEQLNKTLAESSNPEKFKGNRSDSWKCPACNATNSRGRITCFACCDKKPEMKKKTEAPKPGPAVPVTSQKVSNDVNNIHYKELMELQDAELVPNLEPFSCPVCMVDYSPGEGIILKDCLHTFCRPCLQDTVKYSEDAEVKCPYLDDKYSCMSVLQQREIKALVSQKIFESHLAKSVKEAENKIGNAFHCKTPDCKGWCVYEDNVNVFNCPVCRLTNCLTCHAIHEGVNCREYQERMKDASETDEDAMKTRKMLEEMVQKGEAMACPKCQVVLMKKWGCDWLRCSMCKTEICWVTRGFRWGPGVGSITDCQINATC
ncbi:hypothetical protein RUM44_007446 [Polyplax serrata]|uniref:RanBP-type and C3HC4-type zinc finger-containing protein 1 n=1 Tax=Polyplax serrata TaxID=468196 RepID=A0ABR1B2C0_POLSC